MSSPVPDDYLQQRLHRVEQNLDQVGSLLVPSEISDGIKQAIILTGMYADSALASARKVLDFIASDLYKREFHRSPGTQPLENTLQQLVKADKLPKRLAAYASSVRELGNLGAHGDRKEVTQDDVVTSLENLMKLVAWYCERVRPGAAEEPAVETEPRTDQKAAEEEAHRLPLVEEQEEQATLRREQEREAQVRTAAEAAGRIEAEKAARAQAQKSARDAAEGSSDTLPAAETIIAAFASGQPDNCREVGVATAYLEAARREGKSREVLRQAMTSAGYPPKIAEQLMARTKFEKCAIGIFFVAGGLVVELIGLLRSSPGGPPGWLCHTIAGFVVITGASLMLPWFLSRSRSRSSGAPRGTGGSPPI